MSEVVIVIPARMASSRFPGKPLVDLGGKPMLLWVTEAARASGLTARVLVATPDQEILDFCSQIGVEAVLTRLDHPSGTDRLAEVSEKVPASLYVNVQGDEPLIHPQTISAAARPLLEDESVMMGSVFADCAPEEFDNPAVVKVVLAKNSDALYFSRHCIPFERNARVAPVRKHIGVYAYRGAVLREFAAWPVGELEAAESLEQLRFLENGVRIRMSRGHASELAVDTPEQAEQVRQILRERWQSGHA